MLYYPKRLFDLEVAMKTYLAIDLKSFYASVECAERGLDPLDTNLVVADESRTTKTICLAVTPSLKSFGIPGRARLFEVVQKVREINASRRTLINGKAFAGSSSSLSELNENPLLELTYIVAVPRMSLYMKYSSMIYRIYLKYIAPEDIHVYSVDEVFMDITDYLKTYDTTPKELARTMIRDVLSSTGITATAGIGTNLYLAKVAMDVLAKHIPADETGARIAILNEDEYRRRFWGHRPITDFWRFGRGYAKRLSELGLYTLGDIALCSTGGENDFYNEALLYNTFGVNAELIIDHAWGYEPCTIADIKAYRPLTHSVSQGQVLKEPYSNEKAALIVKEMTDDLVLKLVDNCLVTDKLVLDVGYDIENLENKTDSSYRGSLKRDHYGRMIPKPAHGTTNLPHSSSSIRLISEAVQALFFEITDPALSVRRLTLTACDITKESDISSSGYVQLSLFDIDDDEDAGSADDEKEKKMQQAVLSIKKRYGKNAVLRGMNLEDGATAIERNGQVGGHRA